MAVLSWIWCRHHDDTFGSRNEYSFLSRPTAPECLCLTLRFRTQSYPFSIACRTFLRIFLLVIPYVVPPPLFPHSPVHHSFIRFNSIAHKIMLLFGVPTNWSIHPRRLRMRSRCWDCQQQFTMNMQANAEDLPEWEHLPSRDGTWINWIDGTLINWMHI